MSGPNLKLNWSGLEPKLNQRWKMLMKDDIEMMWVWAKSRRSGVAAGSPEAVATHSLAFVVKEGASGEMKKWREKWPNGDIGAFTYFRDKDRKIERDEEEEMRLGFILFFSLYLLTKN